MKKGQGLVVGLLILIAAMLGVVIAMLVRPSVEGVVLSNGSDNSLIEDEVTTPPVEAAPADVNPIDAIVENVIESDAGINKPTEVKVGSIPRTFWGTWSEAPEFCGQETLGQGMMRLTASKLLFPQATGAVTSVLLRGAMAMEVTAAFPGRDAKMAFSVGADQQELLVEEGDGAGARYRRCPEA